MIHIVDYGVGNVRALVSAYHSMDIPAKAVKTASEFQSPSHIVLPGVGAFDQAMQLLDKSAMRDQLEDYVRVQKVPVLGICVGMQMLAISSEEGHERGLGWIDAEVRRLPEASSVHHFPLPHMGWNDVRRNAACKLLSSFETDPQFYFLHSYVVEGLSPQVNRCISDYGHQFSSVVWQDNVYGVQFHPEKSHHWGLTLLRNFSEVK